MQALGQGQVRDFQEGKSQWGLWNPGQGLQAAGRTRGRCSGLRVTCCSSPGTPWSLPSTCQAQYPKLPKSKGRRGCVDRGFRGSGKKATAQEALWRGRQCLFPPLFSTFSLIAKGLE